MTSIALTPPEREAALTIERLKQLVGLVDYDESTDPFPVTAMDAIVFVSGNATQSAHFYQHAFGMTLVGYSGPETGNRDHKGFVLRSGSSRFVILGAVDPSSRYADHHRAHGDGERTELAGAFVRAQRDLGGARLAVPGRLKFTLFDLYFRRAAVAGMTDPYFLETLVSSDLFPFERPFVVAHEWSHLAGYADEGEANFVGWLTCLRGSDGDQYSGWLFLYGEILGSVRAADRADIAGRLAAGPRADRRAIADRVRRHVNPRVSAAGWRVYDRYLKANRVEAGAASYAEVVRLALGVRFGPDWTPLRK